MLSLVLSWRYAGVARQLRAEEKRLLFIFFLVFFTSILSAIANDALGSLADRLGIELRYLLFIPLYLLMRSLTLGFRVFVLGLILSSVVGFAQAIHSFAIEGTDVVPGVYGNQIFFASVYGVIAVVLLDVGIFVETSRLYRYILLVGFLLASSAVVMAGSRGGYVELIGLLLVWSLVRLRGARSFVFALALSVLSVSVYLGSERVSGRVDEAIADVSSYLTIEDKARYTGQLSNQGLRLEAMRTALMIAMENPVMGVGKGGYNETVELFVKRGLVNPQMNLVGHPHNAYLEVFATKGLVGLAVFLLMLCYPLIFFFKQVSIQTPSAVPGFLLICGFAIASLTESSPFIRGGFLSVLLVFLAVFFSASVQTQENE